MPTAIRAITRIQDADDFDQFQAFPAGVLLMTPDVVPEALIVPAGYTALWPNMAVPLGVTVEAVGLLVDPGWSVRAEYRIDLGSLAAFPASWEAATWSIAGGIVTNTPTLGVNQLTNSNMETGDPPSSWTLITGAVLSSAADERTGGTGVASLNVVKGTHPAGHCVQGNTSGSRPVGWWQLGAWLKRIDADAGWFVVPNSPSEEFAAPAWTFTRSQARIDVSASISARLAITGDTGEQVRFDDVELRQVDTASCMALYDYGSVIYQATFPKIITEPYARFGGIVLAYTDASNYVVAYHYAGYVSVVECVAGTFNELASVLLAHDPDKHFSVKKLGQTLSVYYGTGDYETLVGGATLTINAALTGTKLGLFSAAPEIEMQGEFSVGDYSGAVLPSVGNLSVVYMGTSVTNAASGYREYSANWLDYSHSDTFTITNASKSGSSLWNNAYRLDTALAYNPDVVIFDGINDGHAFHREAMEGMIRRIWAARPTCKIVFVKVFSLSAGSRFDDANANPTAMQAWQQTYEDMATHYGIPTVDYEAKMQELVAGGRHLYEFLIDTVHPNAIGHQVISSLLEPVLTDAFLTGTQKPAVLPARLYDDGSYENAGFGLNGTAYTSRTGTWTDSGTTVSSSEAGATITYSGTLQSFGIDPGDGSTPPVVQMSLDGGAYSSLQTSTNGTDIGSRGAHTVTLKVVSGTLKIATFMAI